MTPIAIDLEACRVGPWHDEFRRLRNQIFVVEQSWNCLASDEEPGLTRRDPADLQARFWLARFRGALIGAVRVCAVGETFPHEELFAHHLGVREFAAVRPQMGSLNSLMVDREWRRCLCTSPDGKVGTVAGLLLQSSLSGSAEAGLRVIVATAQTAISARALMRAGFRVIDPPVRTHLHAGFVMCNVAIALTAGDSNVLAAARYFEERQRQALGLESIDVRFAEAMRASDPEHGAESERRSTLIAVGSR
jgi:hypothetical protein